MAHKFIAMLPPGEAPEYTDGREGYYWVKDLNGNSAKTVLKMDVRDFTQQGYQQRMKYLATLATNCQALWGDAAVTITLADRYQNVANSLQGDASFPIEIAKQAYARNHIKMKTTPMRVWL